MARVPNPSGSQWLSMACTCLQKESLWALAIKPFRESQGAAFPGAAVHRSSEALWLPCSSADCNKPCPWGSGN